MAKKEAQIKAPQAEVVKMPLETKVGMAVRWIGMHDCECTGCVISEKIGGGVQVAKDTDAGECPVVFVPVDTLSEV